MTQPAVYKLGLVQKDDDDDKVSPVCISNDLLCVITRGDELSDDQGEGRAVDRGRREGRGGVVGAKGRSPDAGSVMLGLEGERRLGDFCTDKLPDDVRVGENFCNIVLNENSHGEMKTQHSGEEICTLLTPSPHDRKKNLGLS